MPALLALHAARPGSEGPAATLRFQPGCERFHRRYLGERQAVRHGDERWRRRTLAHGRARNADRADERRWRCPGLLRLFPVWRGDQPICRGPNSFSLHRPRTRSLGTQPGTADDRDYMHQRSTLPQLGRFLTVEPIGGNPFNPQSWNRFTYALNNPLKYTDPLGLLTHSETITVFPTQPEVGPTNGPNTFDPPKTGPGDETAGGDGSSSASSSKTETPDSETPPCDAVDRFYAGAESLVRKVLPLEVSINISRPPFALNLNLNFSESRRASLYVGGGLGAGRGGVAMSGRFAGVSRGPGSQGVTGRFSFSSPPFLLGVLGLGTSVSVSEGGMDPRFTAGLGPSGGPSFTVTGGYTLVSDPIGKSVGPCE